MANNFARILQRLWSTPQAGVTDSDQDLLAQYFEENRQEAFSAVVHRHAPLVYNVCRRVLNDDQEAEDAFQATFLVLSRRPAAQRVRSLGGWLYYVAYRLALRRRRQRDTRRSHERQAMKNQPLQTSPKETQNDLREVLDEELEQLPTKYRETLIHCDMMGQSHEQAARELGLPRGSLARWLAGAREALRHRLERRGVALSVSALSAYCSQEAMAAPPRSLLAEVLTTVANKNMPHLISAGVASQADEMIFLLRQKSLRNGIVAVMLGCAVIGGLGWGALIALERSKVPSNDRTIVVLNSDEPLSSISFAPDGQRLVSATLDGRISFWDLESRKESYRLFEPKGDNAFPFPGRNVLWSPNGRTVATKQANEAAQVWDSRTKIGQVLGKPSDSAALAYSPNGKRLAFVNAENSIELWEVATGKRARSFPAKEPVLALAFSPNNDLLASVEGKRRISVRSVVDGKVQAVLKDFEEDVRQIGFAGNTLLILGKCIHFRGLDDSKIKDIGQDVASLECFALSPDGKMLAAGSGDATFPFVYVWDVESGRLTAKLEGHGADIGSVSFSPDSTRLASCSTDRLILVWKVGNGRFGN